MTVLKKLICKKVKSDENDFLTMIGAGRGHYDHFVYEKGNNSKKKKNKNKASTQDDTSNDSSSTTNTADVSSSSSSGPSMDALPAVMDFVQIKIGSGPSTSPPPVIVGGDSTSMSSSSTKRKKKNSSAAQSISSSSSSSRQRRQQGQREQKPPPSSSPAPCGHVFDAVKAEFGNLDDLAIPAEWIIDYNLFETPTAPKWKTPKAPPTPPSLLEGTHLPRITSSVRRHYLDVEERKVDVDERDELEDGGGTGGEDDQYIVNEVRKSLRPEPRRRNKKEMKKYLDAFTYRCTDEIAQAMVPNNSSCLLAQCGVGRSSTTGNHPRNMKNKDLEISQVLFRQAKPKDSEIAQAMLQRIQIQEQHDSQEWKQGEIADEPQRMHIQEQQQTEEEEEQRRIPNSPSEEKEVPILYGPNDSSSKGIIAPKPIVATTSAAASTAGLPLKMRSSMRSQCSSSSTRHRAKVKKMMRWADVLEEVQEESTASMIAKAATTLKEQHQPLPLPSSDYLDRFRKNDHRGRAKAKELPKDRLYVDYGDDDSYNDEDDDTSYNSLLSIDRSSAYDYDYEEDDDYTYDYDDSVVALPHQGGEPSFQYDEQSVLSVGTMELVCNHVTCAPSDRLRAIDWLK